MTDDLHCCMVSSDEDHHECCNWSKETNGEQEASDVRVDDLKIIDWIHPVFHMNHIHILKGSADMHDAIHLLNVRQKSIS